jgi:Hemerythrin HHE cation binding domain
MKPSEIRAELLEQHADIRRRIAELRQAFPATGDAAREQLDGRLAQLVGLFRKHNAREEELLRDILPTVDAWGPARAETMIEEHAKEHTALYAALLDVGTLPSVTGPGAAPGADAAEAQLVPLLDRILEHVDHEEKTFLTEEVLRDDGIVRDYFGG